MDYDGGFYAGPLDTTLSLEREEDAEFAERELAAELLRKAGGKGRVEVNPYHCKLRWVSRRGFVNLREVAGYVNRKYVIKLELQRVQIEKQAREVGAAEAVGGEGESTFAVHVVKPKMSKPDSRVLPKSEVLLKNGGACLDPKMLVISYPGKSRLELFEILAEMKMEFGEEGADVHVMNEAKSESGWDATPLPEDWVEAFGGLPTWTAMVIHLQGIRRLDGSYPYADGVTAPRWFVEQWGRAAWNAAGKSKMTGSGVVVFHSWIGYTWSVWCQLEFLFCKCLVQRYPRSVYVIDCSQFTHKKRLINRGYFMKGTESYY